MDFLSSQTIINLGRAFAGESQARNRYELYAYQAKKDGYEYMSNLICEIAGNEFAHAERFFNMIKTYSTDPVKNIKIDAGYPYDIATTTGNMKFAADGEHMEATSIYPEFAQIAKSEGFSDIENLFKLIAKVESHHNKIFKQLNEKLSSGTLYKSDTPTEWQCMYCGHQFTSNNAWEKCPLCGKPQGWVILKLEGIS